MQHKGDDGDEIKTIRVTAAAGVASDWLVMEWRRYRYYSTQAVHRHIDDCIPTFCTLWTSAMR